ncbi:MAG TPA: hypothetical protein VFX98_01245 [Longimicrobiaceae bacterium]|nr:hypothetical protein [Longimicrobiaceae bacterium]
MSEPPPTPSPFRDPPGLAGRALRRFAGLERALRPRAAELRAIVELAMWLHWRATDEPGSHVFHGGHVWMYDGGRFYRFVREYVRGGRRWDWWWGGRRLRGGSRRWSQTHATRDEPYEVTLPARLLSGWGCILVGTHAGGSWFQAEATSVKRGLIPFLHHNLVDFVTYRLTGRQRGPLGSSDRTDRRPILVPAEVCEEGLAAWGIP